MEEIRTVLAKHGFFFKKKFGQNFLTDSNLLDAIVRDAGVDASTTVLEIGAGAGALTRALSRAAKKVLAYEIECASDGTYFVYIDAVTGEETDILYVVDGEQGRVTV